MTHEELISELRNSKGWANLGNAAADCIEQLTNTDWQVEAMTQIARLHYALDRAEAAESKLARAVEAIREMMGCGNPSDAHEIGAAMLTELEKTE